MERDRVGGGTAAMPTLSNAIDSARLANEVFQSAWAIRQTAQIANASPGRVSQCGAMRSLKRPTSGTSTASTSVDGVNRTPEVIGLKCRIASMNCGSRYITP